MRAFTFLALKVQGQGLHFRYLRWEGTEGCALSFSSWTFTALSDRGQGQYPGIELWRRRGQEEGEVTEARFALLLLNSFLKMKRSQVTLGSVAQITGITQE